MQASSERMQATCVSVYASTCTCVYPHIRVCVHMHVCISEPVHAALRWICPAACMHALDFRLIGMHMHEMLNVMHMHAILNVMHMHAKLNVMHMHEMLNVMHMHAMLNVMHMHAKLNVILSRLHTVNICSKHPLLCLRTLTLEPAVGVAQLRAAPRPSLSLVRLHPNALVNGWATRTGISLVNG